MKRAITLKLILGMAVLGLVLWVVGPRLSRSNAASESLETEKAQLKQQRSEILNNIEDFSGENLRSNVLKAYNISIKLAELGDVDVDTVDTAEKAVFTHVKLEREVAIDLRTILERHFNGRTRMSDDLVQAFRSSLKGLRTDK